jgi:hypothetical protein
MKHKKIIIISAIVLLVLIIFGTFVALRTKAQVQDLFRMNKELQEEGYYMGDFEFKMMSVLFYLDKGKYYNGLSLLNKIHTQFKSKEGLVKMPDFNSKEEEIEFYLNLQNPKTGAFIDDTYPYLVYNEVTENAISNLDALTKEIGKPLKLKYPLKYLDEINTPEKLRKFLDDVAYVSWISTKFPQTSYVFARSIFSYSSDDGIIGKNGFYKFSDEWKQALLQWFYDNQDPETGFWGPRLKSNHKLIKKDLTNTASIIKSFVDKDGNSIYKNFPLRYGKQMFKTAVEVMAELTPNVNDLDEWHEWELKMGKGTYMLTRYIWQYAEEEDKVKAEKLIEDFIKTNFVNCYIPKEGAFSYYPKGEHATLDGSGMFSVFKDVGAFSSEKQQKLWGGFDKTIINLGTQKVSKVDESSFDLIAKKEGVNSLRVYKEEPDYNNLFLGVSFVIYSSELSVPDIMDLTFKMKNWINKTDQSMGNWTSKEEVKGELAAINFTEVPVFEKEAAVENINSILSRSNKVVIVGFDILQVPRYKIVFEK